MIRTALHVAPAIVLLAVAAPAAAQQIVVDEGPTSPGQVTLEPAVAVIGEDGGALELANGGAVNVTATLTLEASGADNADEVPSTVHLAPGEVATIRIPDATTPLSRLVANLESGAELATFVVAQAPAPAALAVAITDSGAVHVEPDSTTAAVVSVQVRQRSWLGATSSHVSGGPFALPAGGEPIEVDAGSAPWVPGPSWIDVLVVDHLGNETRGG